MTSGLRRLFTPMTGGAARAIVFLFAFTLLLAAANLLWTARVVSGANTRAQALCQFDADLGSVPLPAGVKPSRFGVTIISDARVAFRQAGCTGRLPPPDPGFTRWAAYYKLPAG